MVDLVRKAFGTTMFSQQPDRGYSTYKGRDHRCAKTSYIKLLYNDCIQKFTFHEMFSLCGVQEPLGLVPA